MHGGSCEYSCVVVSYRLLRLVIAAQWKPKSGFRSSRRGRRRITSSASNDCTTWKRTSHGALYFLTQRNCKVEEEKLAHSKKPKQRESDRQWDSRLKQTQEIPDDHTHERSDGTKWAIVAAEGTHHFYTPSIWWVQNTKFGIDIVGTGQTCKRPLCSAKTWSKNESISCNMDWSCTCLPWSQASPQTLRKSLTRQLYCLFHYTCMLCFVVRCGTFAFSLLLNVCLLLLVITLPFMCHASGRRI